jgi:hypothetical protein
MNKFLGLIILLISNQAFCSLQYSKISNDKHKIYSARVNPKKYDVRLAKALDGKLGLENLVSIAKRHNPVVSVNAGFFEKDDRVNGLPSGIYIDKTLGQEFISCGTYPLLYFSNNSVDIASSYVKGFISFDDEKIDICSVNKPHRESHIIVYTPSYWDSTLTDKGTYEITVQNNQITLINPNGNSKIPSNGFVLVATDHHGQNILRNKAKLGATSHYGIVFDNPKLYEANYVVSGSNLLLENKQIPEELFPQDDTFSQFKDGKKARTAACRFANGDLGLFVADSNNVVGKLNFDEVREALTYHGYTNQDILNMKASEIIGIYENLQQDKIQGVSLFELAKFLYKQKCVHAINLDGGSSSTFVYKNELINNPAGMKNIKQSGVASQISNAIIVLDR